LLSWKFLIINVAMVRFPAIFLSILFAYQSLAFGYDDPGVFEVQLISPRNGTWQPTSNMPIIFAVKNPRLASPLGIESISWRFGVVGKDSNRLSDSGEINLRSLNTATPSPYIAIDRTGIVGNVEGEWRFGWSIYLQNCSNSITQIREDDSGGGNVATTNIWWDVRSNVMQFTTRNAATPMSVEAVMSGDDTCRSSDTVALEVKDFIRLPGWTQPDDQYGRMALLWRPSCAILGPTPTEASPCTFNGTTKSSVAAQVSYYGCKSNCTRPGERSAASSSNGLDCLLFAVLLCTALGVILN
jgi:hypothetical protein